MIKRIFNYITNHSYVFINRMYFKECGQNVKIINPLQIVGKRHIAIGQNVTIGYKAWLSAAPIKNNCIFKIGKGTYIGNFCHICATAKIIIGERVSVADKVYISDNTHDFKNPHIPIMDQPILQNGEVTIGDGSWIGENACILGVKIGKNCIVGANSVVMKDIPDYCVVMGSPARIIKKYDLKLKKWL
jgi:acetyltransferase-like isoleucine patch superfamily enzyme